MNITGRPLNLQALTLEEAQGLIRKAVKDNVLQSQSKTALEKQVQEIIRQALEHIRIPSLRDAARRSLIQFYKNELNKAREISRRRLFLFLCLLRLGHARGMNLAPEDMSGAVESIPLVIAKRGVTRFREEDVPDFQNYSNNMFGEYVNSYYKKRIKTTVDRMAREEALDPDAPEYIGQRNTLRARAEREVSWKGHADELAAFKERGVKLVIISTHANCSKRCFPFQGRVFSLDGTSGRTSDGRAYVPLEKATDIYTPNGKWKNGLFGFNCRHFMVEYQPGMAFPRVSEETERREYAIDQRMRSMEREIRRMKADLEMSMLAEDSRRLKKQISASRRFYKDYAKKHGRAYYASRIKVI